MTLRAFLTVTCYVLLLVAIYYGTDAVMQAIAAGAR